MTRALSVVSTTTKLSELLLRREMASAGRHSEVQNHLFLADEAASALFFQQFQQSVYFGLPRIFLHLQKATQRGTLDVTE